VGSGLELARLGFLNGTASGSGVGMARGGARLELSVLGFQDGAAMMTSIGRRGGSLALELAGLDGPVVTETALLGLGSPVTLVSVDEPARYLGGTEGLLGEEGIGNLCVLFLGGAGRAPDFIRVFLEGLQVQGKATSRTLEAEFVVGVVTSNEGLEGISGLVALCAGFARHC